MLDNRMNTFLTLCREMNYRRAGEALNLTQPAVTQHIHFLEAHYQCKLFRYDHKVLQRTDEGKILLAYAESMKYQEKCLDMRIHKREKPKLCIGATKTIGECVMGKHLAAFVADGGYRVEVEVENTALLLKKLDRGELDFALIEGFFDRKKYASAIYRKEDFLGICGEDHRFAGKTISIREALSETLLVREEGSGTRKILENTLRNFNLNLSDFHEQICLSSFSLIAELLREKRGISFAYRAVGKKEHALSTFRLEEVNVEHEFNYVCLNNPEAIKRVKRFDAYKKTERAHQKKDEQVPSGV